MQWRNCLLLLLLCGLGDNAIAKSANVRKYLVPLMWHGPSNQINAVKETLALASILGDNVHVAVPDLQQQGFSDGNYDPLPFDVLYDLPHLQASANVILLAELAQKLPDWNRTLDALLVVGNYKEKGNVPRLASEMGLEAPPKRLWLKSPVSMLGCQPEQIAELRALLEPYDVVGVQSFHGLFAGSQMLAGPLGKGCGNDTCCDGFQKATMAVRKAPQVREAAKDFITKRIGKEQSFVAAHVRPYPDGCIMVWIKASQGDQTEAMAQECNNEYLYDRFAPSLKSLLLAYKTDKLFIMTHPKVRSVVLSKLHEHGVEPIFMDLEEALPVTTAIGRSALAGGTSPRGFNASVSATVLAMLEEAVCAHAAAFVGSKESSMTGSIVQERISAGASLNDSYSFFRWEGFEKKPVQLSHYYQLKESNTRAIMQNLGVRPVHRAGATTRKHL